MEGPYYDRKTRPLTCRECALMGTVVRVAPSGRPLSLGVHRKRKVAGPIGASADLGIRLHSESVTQHEV